MDLYSTSSIASNPYIVAAGITATVATASLAVTNALSYLENRKKRNIAVVTNQSIAHKEACRECASQVLAQTHPLLLSEPSVSTDELFAIKQNLLEACSKLEIMISVGTEEEQYIYTDNAMRELVKTFFAVAYGEEDMSSLVEKHTHFREVMVAFDNACWKQLKGEADGVLPGSSRVFRRLYRGELEKCVGSKRPVEWVDEEIKAYE